MTCFADRSDSAIVLTATVRAHYLYAMRTSDATREMKTAAAIVMALIAALWALSARADVGAEDTGPETAHDARVGTSGLPVPRYVSLGAGEVNMRTGPGTRYPIKWIYTRKSLPVRVEAEYDIWRKVRDRDGETGWVHGSLLSGRRYVLIEAEGGNGTQTLYTRAHPASEPVLRAEKGVIAELVECGDGWCRVRIDGKRGWLPRSALWGVPDDTGGS